MLSIEYYIHIHHPHFAMNRFLFPWIRSWESIFGFIHGRYKKSSFRSLYQTFLSSLIFLMNSSMKTNESGRFTLIWAPPFNSRSTKFHFSDNHIAIWCLWYQIMRWNDFQNGKYAWLFSWEVRNNICWITTFNLYLKSVDTYDQSHDWLFFYCHTHPIT